MKLRKLKFLTIELQLRNRHVSFQKVIMLNKCTNIPLPDKGNLTNGHSKLNKIEFFFILFIRF